MVAAQLSQGESGACEMWIDCANLNKKLNNSIQAEYCLTRALKLDKNNIYLLKERALLLEELCKFKKAVITYEKLFDLSCNELEDNKAQILIKISELYESNLELTENAIQILESNYKKVDNGNNHRLILRLFDLYLKYDFPMKGKILYEDLKNNNNSDNNNINNTNNVAEVADIKIRYLLCCLSSINNNNSNDNIFTSNLYNNINIDMFYWISRLGDRLGASVLYLLFFTDRNNRLVR